MQPDPLEYRTPANLAANQIVPATPWLRGGIIGLWIVIVGVIAVRLGLKPDHNSVFYPLFYNTGKTWNADGDVYFRIQDFRYSPLVAAFFGLLSRMAVLPAQYIWMGLNVGVLVWGVGKWLKVAAPRVLSEMEIWIIALMVTPLMVGNINNLQANPLMLGLMLLALASCEEKRWWLAAWAIAAATMLKLYPLTLGMILVVHFPRQLSWRLFIALAVGAVLPYALGPTNYVNWSYYQWIHGLAAEDRSAMGLDVMYRDAGSIWAFYVGPVYPPYYRLFQAVTAGLVGVVSFWALFWKSPKRSTLAFLWTVLCVWILLAGPSTESATYMVGALPAAWLMLESFRRPGAIFLKLLAIGSFGFLVIGTASSWVPMGRAIKAFGWQPLSIVLLLAAIITWKLTPSAADEPTATPGTTV